MYRQCAHLNNIVTTYMITTEDWNRTGRGSSEEADRIFVQTPSRNDDALLSSENNLNDCYSLTIIVIISYV